MADRSHSLGQGVDMPFCKSFEALALLAILGLMVPSSAVAEQPKSSKMTYVYKSVGDCSIQADVYRPAEGGAARSFCGFTAAH